MLHYEQEMRGGLGGELHITGTDYPPPTLRTFAPAKHLQLLIHNASAKKERRKKEGERKKTQMHFIVSFCILFYPRRSEGGWESGGGGGEGGVLRTF